MGVFRRLPIAAMLLIAIVPYTAWADFRASYPEWHAHRAALVAWCGLLLCALVLQRLSVSPIKAAVLLTFPILGVLATVVSPVVMLVTLGAASLAAVIDRRRAYENTHLALIVMGASLLGGAVMPLVQVSAFEREVMATTPDTPLSWYNADIVLKQTPSIVHIVLDGYGSTQTLRSIYAHDTRPFFAELEERGFIVIEDAVSPFSQTLPTMASVMSGAFVDMASGNGDPTLLRLNLGHTIRNGVVPSVLQNAGYTFARSESGYSFLDFDKAEIVPKRSISMSLLDAYLLRDLGNFFGTVNNGALRAALTPGIVDDLPQPFFYYQHLIAPHPPFSIAADGSFRETDDMSFNDGMAGATDEKRADYVEGYREKAQFIERSVIQQLDALPKGPMIVVIHGDHGPGAFHDYNAADNTCMSERLRTFVAVYSDIPEITETLQAAPDGGFSTVNIYRAVFAGLSGNDISLVPAKAIYLPYSDPSTTVPVSAAELNSSCVPQPT